jgi:hypothetical protein
MRMPSFSAESSLYSSSFRSIHNGIRMVGKSGSESVVLSAYRKPTTLSETCYGACYGACRLAGVGTGDCSAFCNWLCYGGDAA